MFEVAAPIGAGDFHQLESVADLAGRSHVRAPAEVGPLALAIELQLLIGGNGVDQLDLERFALLFEQALRVLARDGPLQERLVAGDDLAHPLFDRGEILGRERLVAEEVVVEAVLDHRPNGDLRSWPKRLHGFGENMRRIVADQFERARIIARYELERSVAIDRISEVGKLAIADHRHGALGKRRRNGFGDFEAGDAGLIGALSAIGKSDVDHRGSSSSVADTNRRKHGRSHINVEGGQGNGEEPGIAANPAFRA